MENTTSIFPFLLPEMIKVPYGSCPVLVHKHGPGSLAARVPTHHYQAEADGGGAGRGDTIP